MPAFMVLDHDFLSVSSRVRILTARLWFAVVDYLFAIGVGCWNVFLFLRLL